jgi:hypothetical protein
MWMKSPTLSPPWKKDARCQNQEARLRGKDARGQNQEPRQRMGYGNLTLSPLGRKMQEAGIKMQDKDELYESYFIPLVQMIDFLND